MYKEKPSTLTKSIKDDLKAIPIFKNCDEAFFEALSKECHYQTHRKGKILFLHEDKADRFYFTKSGWVKLFRETLDGTQAVIDVVDGGNLFGQTAIFENDEHPYSAEVVVSAELISLPLSFLKREIQTNTQLMLNMLDSLASYKRIKDKEIEHRTVQNAPQRIGCFLLRLSNDEQEGPFTIHLPYDKTLVAARLGMQPETFSRALAKLRSKTGIKISGSTIYMDSLDPLINYSCSACSSEFPCADFEKDHNRK